MKSEREQQRKRLVSQRLSAAQKLFAKKRAFIRKIKGFKTGRTKGFRAKNILELLICRFLGAEMKPYGGKEPPAELEYKYGLCRWAQITLLSESITLKAEPVHPMFRHFDSLKQYNEYCIENNLGCNVMHTAGYTDLNKTDENRASYAVKCRTDETYTCYGSIDVKSGVFAGVDVNEYALFMALLHIKAGNNRTVRHDIFFDAPIDTLKSVRVRYARWSLADCPIAWNSRNAEKSAASLLLTIISGLLWDLRFRGIQVMIYAATEPDAGAQALARTSFYSNYSTGALPILLHCTKPETNGSAGPNSPAGPNDPDGSNSPAGPNSP